MCQHYLRLVHATLVTKPHLMSRRHEDRQLICISRSMNRRLTSPRVSPIVPVCQHHQKLVHTALVTKPHLMSRRHEDRQFICISRSMNRRLTSPRVSPIVHQKLVHTALVTKQKTPECKINLLKSREKHRKCK